MIEYTVGFKSTPENYENEKSGRKPNTSREVDDETDERFERLLNGTAKRIRITNTETGEYFEREITDVTQWKLETIIISWDNTEQARLQAKREVFDDFENDHLLFNKNCDCSACEHHLKLKEKHLGATEIKKD